MASPKQEDVVALDLDNNNTAKIHLYGATLISWVRKSEEKIFVSSKSHFDNKKAIRGGIPLVFPNFGPWDLGPQHGFARITRWNVESQPSKNSNGDVSVTLSISDSDETRKMWNYKFKLMYVVTLGKDFLKTELITQNTGGEDFSFTCLLHTYFRVPDVEKCQVSGLKGLTFTDKLAGGAQAQESRELVEVHEGVDRVYECTPATHTLTNTSGGHSVQIVKENLPDTVVWNPWEKAAGMSDFGDNEYPNMICVEAGYVSKPYLLVAGGTFSASQTLKAML